MHRSYELQGSLKRRRKHPHPTSINGYHTVKNGLGAIVYKWPTFTFVHESGYTLGSRRKIAHSGSHAETRAFRMGVVSLPSGYFTRFGNPAWPGVRTAYFAAFESWLDVLSKNAESLRDSDALMRVAVPRRRGPAGLRDPVTIVSMIKNMINPWAGSFLIFCWANANSIKKVVLQPF